MTKSVGAINADLMQFILQNQQQTQKEAATIRDVEHEIGIAMLTVSHVFRGIEVKQQEWNRTKSYIDAGVAAAGAVAGVAGGAGGGEAAGADGANAGGNAAGGETGQSAAAPNVNNAPSPSGGPGRGQSQAQADQVTDGGASAGGSGRDGASASGSGGSDGPSVSSGEGGQGPQATGSPQGPAENRVPANAQRNAEQNATDVESAANADGTPDAQPAEEKKPSAFEIASKLWSEGTKVFDAVENENVKLSKEAQKNTQKNSEGIFRASDEADEARDAERELTKEIIDTMLPSANRNIIG